MDVGAGLIVLVLAISIGSLVVAVFLARWVLGADTGTDAMREIANAIREGAEAFLRRQYRTIAVLGAVTAVVVFLLYAVVRPEPSDIYDISRISTAVLTALSFLFGAVSSGIAGYIGMYVSIRANVRTAAAVRTSLDRALKISMRGGAVSGLFVVGLSLLGVTILFLVGRAFGLDDTYIPLFIVGYGFGASFVALFAQLGGGIYTKAADVGADLVGKVEAGIPEDDARNPAVIADLVGDNVGDCAGRGADLFESTAAENIGAMILAAPLIPIFGAKVLFFPLVARAFGTVSSIIGLLFVKTEEDEDPMKALNRGYYVTSVLAAIGFVGAAIWLLRGGPQGELVGDAWWKFAICGAIGIATAIAFVYITQYYTEYKYRPVREIAQASVTGPATNVISGISVGLETAGLPIIAIAIALITSYRLGQNALADVATISQFSAGLFGTAVATMGMLGTAAYILAMDTFGPITDNAGGIVEMSGEPDEVRVKTDRLDAVGNTTKALTKGYAIGSAGLAAFLLFSAYIGEVQALVEEDPGSQGLTALGDGAFSINLSNPLVFAGGLLGGALVFVFASLCIRAVGKAAQVVIEDVRAQFRENPGIMDRTVRPDYARSVTIVTSSALRQMILPGILAVGFPIVIGLLFRMLDIGAEAVAALLIVATIVGILMASLLNNGGGAWDNAKKYIETGALGGKGSEAHKAAVVGDTVGDPFKDTAGPSIHVLIKLLATVTLVMAPLFV